MERATAGAEASIGANRCFEMLRLTNETTHSFPNDKFNVLSG